MTSKNGKKWMKTTVNGDPSVNASALGNGAFGGVTKFICLSM